MLSGTLQPTAVAVVVAGVLEAAVVEPPRRLHPVAWLGRVVGVIDRDWARPNLVGALAALAVPLATAGVAGGVVAVAATVDPWLAALFAGLGLFVTTSLRMLLSEARRVVSASATDPEDAREALPALAGRDPSTLSPGEIRSAAVESAAENLADGLVAPLGAFVAMALLARPLGPTAALALATGAAAWVKAVNTLDSMLGYRSKPVGRAPARLDDAVMWLPARVSAGFLAVAGGRPGALGEVRPWLSGVPSPNSGWPMGVLASVAGARLEKPGVYVLNPDADLPSVGTAREAVGTVRVAGVVAYALAAVTLALAGVVRWS